MFSKLKRIETSSRQRRGFGEKRLLQQVDNITEAHNDNFNTPAFGDGYWVMYDYNRGYYDDHETSGLMDIFRIPKFSYYFFKSQQPQSEEYVLQIASYWNQNSDTEITVFSNTDEVALYLNDSLIARKTPEKTKHTSTITTLFALFFIKTSIYFPIKKTATILKTPRTYLLAKPPKDKPKAMPGFSTKSKRSMPRSKIFSPKL